MSSLGRTKHAERAIVAQLQETEQRLATKLDGIAGKLDTMNGKFDTMNGKFDRLIELGEMTVKLLGNGHRDRAAR